MATSKISDNDKKIICEAAENILQKKSGRIRLRALWGNMRKEYSELAIHHKKWEKNKTYGKEFWREFLDIIFEWQQKHSSKIGYAQIEQGKKKCSWFWYGDPTTVPQPASKKNKNGNAGESEFYSPFAEWLEKQNKCTKAVPFGKGGGTKWSNPDVVGVRELQEFSGATNYELVSVEIKISTNTGDIITGFGQACAYKLFSHQSYLVVPTDSKEDDLQRLEELCGQYDIGLIVFDKAQPNNPAFALRCSAKSWKPNPSYVNNSIKKLLKESGCDIFNYTGTINPKKKSTEPEQEWIETIKNVSNDKDLKEKLHDITSNKKNIIALTVIIKHAPEHFGSGHYAVLWDYVVASLTHIKVQTLKEQLQNFPFQKGNVEKLQAIIKQAGNTGNYRRVALLELLKHLTTKD